jgi:DNA-directed RNA polymerase beta' subunit
MSQKRHLTQDEIDDILSEIQNYTPIPKEIDHASIMKTKKYIQSKLVKIQIYPEIYSQLKDTIRKEYYKSIVSPGESVGIIVGQSLGEKQTQSTLNSFHSSGLTIKTVVTGVPRFSELMAATKDPKGIISTVFLKDKFESSTQVKECVSGNLVQILFKELIESFEFIENPPYKRWYKIFSKIHQENIYPHNLLKIKLNKKRIFSEKIDLKKIKESVEDKFEDLQIIYSPLNIMEIHVFFKYKNIPLEEKVQYVDQENKWEVYIEDVVIPNLKNVLICGIEGIRYYIISKGSEYYLETEGSNLKGMGNVPYIDFSRTISNNMWDIYELFGIEATRQFLFEEFSKVLNSDGTFINYRHIKLLVDTMTFNGSIISISRYGTRDKESPMARASFEESLDNFIKAGVFGEVENTKSISSSIMLGKNSTIGTGMCDLSYDTNIQK